MTLLKFVYIYYFYFAMPSKVKLDERVKFYHIEKSYNNFMKKTKQI